MRSGGSERERDSPGGPANPITPRAILLGTLSVAFLAFINPYLAFISRTWSVGSGSLLSSPVVVLFALVLVNGALIRLWPGRAFTRGELLVAYGMLIVSVGLAMQGGIPYIVSATTYPFYMATPENGWQHSIWPNVPPWLRLSQLQANDWFWEGLPEGFATPWAAWLTPMLAWGGFTLALMGAMFCLGALFSKDWIERQRLSFPLVEVPLSIAGDEPRPSLRSSLLNNRIFWLGFALPALISVLQWLHRILPSVPAPELYDLRIGRYFSGMGLPWNVLSDMSFSIIFPIIGITCLLPLEVSLSLWLFYVLYRVQLLVWAGFGIAEEGGQAAIAINPRVFIGFEEAGGFIALSAAMLYQSRRTVGSALRGIFRWDSAAADPYGPLAGHWALVGFLLANGLMIWWAVRAGMSWWAFAGLMGVFYAVLIGASRLVAAGGVMYIDTGFFPRGIMMRLVGAVPVEVPSLVMYSYLSVIYMYDPMNLAMPQMMDSFKLLHMARLRGRCWPWASALAIVAMLGVGIPVLIHLLYQHGAASLGRWPFYSYPQWAFGELDASLRTPELPDNWLRLALVAGGVFMLALVWLHSSFVWWPVSPVGFLIASSYETNRSMWVNVFIAWLIASLVRRYGGLRLFRSVRPAFLGLVLGDYLTDAGLALLSTIFGLHQPPS
jgi:hypothetical protein